MKDCYHGYGKLWVPDGSEYLGLFEKGSKHGKGTQTYVDGSVF